MDLENTAIKPHSHQFHFEERTCPVCGENSTRFWGFRGGKYHRHGLGTPAKIVRCSKCSLIYPNPFPFAKKVQQLYGDPEKYFSHVNEDEKLSACDLFLDQVSARLKKSKFSVLDVGSGRGELVFSAKKRGLTAIGLELSPEMAVAAKRKYDVDLKTQSIEAFAAEHPSTFDLIVLDAVLEHVYDPRSMIENVSKLLNPDGLLFLDLPQEPNLLTIIGNFCNILSGNKAVYNLSPTWEPFHVLGFSPKTLDYLLKEFDLHIESIHLWANPKIQSSSDIKDRVKAFFATQINRIANTTHLASNMHVWAAKGKSVHERL